MAHFSSVPILWRWLVAGALLAASAALRAQAPLTLEEALRVAAERSQQLVAQDAAVAAAREMAVAAGEPRDPTLSIGIGNLPINGPDELSLTRDFMTMRSIGLVRELTRAAKRDARAARFAREADAALAGRALALAELQQATASAWLDRHYRERMRDVLRARRDEAALQIDAADLAYRTGVGSQADVFAARSAAAVIDDRVAEAERNVEIAKIGLARWVGAAADRALADPPPLDVVAVHAAELDATIAHHPMIDVLAKREQTARAEAAIARADKRSDWSLGVMYSARGPAFSDMVSLNASRPLQFRQRNRQDRELAAKLANVEQLRAEREEETRAHLAEVRMALSAWEDNRARLDRYPRELLPLADERTAAAIAAYRGGRGALEAVLDARVDEIATRLAQLALELETARLWAELNYLIPAAQGAGATD